MYRLLEIMINISGELKAEYSFHYGLVFGMLKG